MIKFTVNDAVRSLSKTPGLLRQFLSDLPGNWLYGDEGHGSFSPYDVVGHLIIGEKLDWVPRIKIILEHGESVTFEEFDRFAQDDLFDNVPIATMLDEFETLRKANIEYLLSLNLTYRHLEMKGMHPELGVVTLRNLLSTWVSHDLSHLAQISRVLAKQYKEETGVFATYMNVMSDRSEIGFDDHDWTRFVLRIPIKGTHDELFGAFITQNALEKWFLREAFFTKRNQKRRDPDDPIMPGDEFAFRWYGWHDSVMENGVVLEQNGKRLRFTFSGNTIVTVQLLELPETFLVELAQENIPTDNASKVRYYYMCAINWVFYLTNLKSVLEGGLDLRNRNEAVGGVLNM